jgi:hypothetical protein
MGGRGGRASRRVRSPAARSHTKTALKGGGTNPEGQAPRAHERRPSGISHPPSRSSRRRPCANTVGLSAAHARHPSAAACVWCLGHHAAAVVALHCAAPPPPPLRPSSGLVVARAHAHARASARGGGDGGERWRRIAIARFPRDRFPDGAVSSCSVASCVRRRVSLSSRSSRVGYFRRREVPWREGWVRKAPACPTARSTDRLPYRPPLHARAALEWRSAESARGVLRPSETTKTAFPCSCAPGRARRAL